MPSKILNQMACGRAVLAVTAPGTALARILEETGAGVILPPSNAELLAMTVLNLKNSPDRLERMGQAGRQYILDHAASASLFQSLPAFLAKAVRERPAEYQEYFLKRPLDILLAAAGFIVSSPLWLLIPALIQLEDQGPVFYKQERSGRFGRRFDVLKFRSMRREEHPESARRQARRDDPRVTFVGRWLRATAMDEVPQLWNILKGDMSFVGPRALLPSEIEVAEAYKGAVPLETIPGSARRALMRPGLTGIAQVYAARDISRRQKFRYDLLYLGRQSLSLDGRLILRSGWNSLTARWEKVGHVPVKVR
jgi:lipopolysaccharide/colanic/teichoic acid biosynthesis glycosyltransferase